MLAVSLDVHTEISHFRVYFCGAWIRGEERAFHRSLVVATQNQLLVAIMGVFNEAHDQQLWGHLIHRSFSVGRCEEHISDHRNIANAVYDRDGATAEAAMRTHILRVRQHLLGY